MDIFNYMKENFKIYTVEECKELKDNGAFGFVYMTKCKENGKLYIGQKKFNHGFETYLGSGVAFKEAVKKYGKENFERIILQIAYSKEELNDYEIKYIELFDASEKHNRDFYNIALGGGVIGLKGEDSPNYGKHQSEEHRRKNSEAHKGKKATEEARKKMSEAGKEKEFSEEHRRNLSKAGKGREFSEEHKKKIGEGNRGKKRSEETIKKRTETRKKNRAGEKSIICVFPSGKIIKDIGVSDLAKELGINRHSISNILKSGQPYKPRNKRLKHLEGIIIMEEKDYLNTLKNINKINDKAS